MLRQLGLRVKVDVQASEGRLPGACSEPTGQAAVGRNAAGASVHTR